MAREFDSFGAMALHLLTAGPALALALHEGLDHLGTTLVNRMAGKPGTYQAKSGPFPAWAPLAQSTEDRKQRMGFAVDNPLIERGDLADSFSHGVEGLTLLAGSKDPKMVFHEFGTSRMPPRPVVGPAGYESREMIERLVGAAVVTGMIGADAARDLPGGEIHQDLGYRFTTRR